MAEREGQLTTDPELARWLARNRERDAFHELLLNLGRAARGEPVDDPVAAYWRAIGWCPFHEEPLQDGRCASCDPVDESGE